MGPLCSRPSTSCEPSLPLGSAAAAWVLLAVVLLVVLVVLPLFVRILILWVFDPVLLQLADFVFLVLVVVGLAVLAGLKVVRAGWLAQHRLHFPPPGG